MPAQVGVSKESSDDMRPTRRKRWAGPEILTARWHWLPREHLLLQLEVAQHMGLQKLEIEPQRKETKTQTQIPHPLLCMRWGWLQTTDV